MNRTIISKKVTNRLGNWCEESILREEKLRELLGRVEQGDVEFKRQEHKMKMSNLPVSISPSLNFKQNIMIKSAFLNGYVSAVVPDSYPHIKPTERIPVTISSAQDPREGTSRSCFQLESVFEVDRKNTAVRWGEKFYITLQLPGLDRKLYLNSLPSSFATHTWNNCLQTVYLSFECGSESMWKLDWIDLEYRMEMEYKEVLPYQNGLLTHVQTGNHLSSDPNVNHVIRSDFGVENLVGCHSYRNFSTRLDKDENLFCFATKPQ